MTTMKQAVTNVTNLDLTRAEGGVDPAGISYRLTVECPESYDADLITAEDILHDGQIRLVSAEGAR